jgi:2,3-bisphosphoglycerate-independent phosphoglycerate mutase
VYVIAVVVGQNRTILCAVSLQRARAKELHMAVETLQRLEGVPRPKGPLILAILDGVGWGMGDGGDAVALARTPNLKRLWRASPTVTLAAHGTAVGMPSDADMGNSEVGHNALGAGRVFRQGAALVQDAILSGRIWQGATWKWLMEAVGHNRAHTLHLCGLLSDGNVHAHIDHVLALVAAADREDVRHIRVHALADGRDVGERTFDGFVRQLELALRGYKNRDYRIASGGGRMAITMDRYDADWPMVARGWETHVLGKGRGFASVAKALETLREEPGGQSDQTLAPFVIVDSAGQPIGNVINGDAFVFWNFRGDRAIEITKAFEDIDFHAFDRGPPLQVRFAGMMQYDGDLLLPKRFLVEPPVIERTMGEFLAALRLKTLAVSETQKYGHVTYFWNGNRSGLLAPEFEEYAEVPSERIPFDQRPEMRAHQITDLVLATLALPNPPDFVRLNYPNGDMVGHTGNLPATILAMQALDVELGRLMQVAREMGGILVVTADHGNADDMWMRDSKGRPLTDSAGVPQPKTSHTLNPVPLSIFDPDQPDVWRMQQWQGDVKPGLANVAATLFNLLGFEAPADYAPSLVVPKI